MSLDTFVEPILRATFSRYLLGNSKFDSIKKRWERNLGAFWTQNKISFAEDEVQLQTPGKISPEIRQYIERSHINFLIFDGMINENSVGNFYNEVQVPELRSLYAYYIMIEEIHKDMYMRIVRLLCNHSEEKFQAMCKEVETEPTIMAKAKWVEKWHDRKIPFVERLVAFACIEGIFFFGTFAGIDRMRLLGLLPGITETNEEIRRDENQHWETPAAEVYPLIERKLSFDRFKEILKEAVELEQDYQSNYALAKPIPGLNADLINAFLEHVADRTAVAFGYPKVYSTTNPLDWVVIGSLRAKNQIFESETAEYISVESLSSEPLKLDVSF